jgi:hypothetical protein
MSDDGDPDLLERLAEMYMRIKSGEVTSLAWVTIDPDGEATVGAAGDADQLVEGIDELRKAVSKTRIKIVRGNA